MAICIVTSWTWNIGGVYNFAFKVSIISEVVSFCLGSTKTF